MRMVWASTTLIGAGLPSLPASLAGACGRVVPASGGSRFHRAMHRSMRLLPMMRGSSPASRKILTGLSPRR